MKIKNIRRFLAAGLLLLVAVTATGVASNRKTIAEEEKMDKLITAFSSGISGWDLSGDAAVSGGAAVLLPGSKIQTQKQMNNFMMIAEIKDVAKGFDFSFGDSDGENVFIIRFDGAFLYLTNLLTQQNESLASLPDKLYSNSMLKIEVMSGEVSVAVKEESQPTDYLGTVLARFKFTDNMPSRFGKIGFSAYDGSMVSLSGVKLYSLASEIYIETENYVPRVSGKTPRESNLKVILLSTLIPIAALGAAAAVFFILRGKRSKNNEKVV